MSEFQDAKRYRVLKNFLYVASNEPGGWTRWLELQEIPYRTKTEDVDEFVDHLIELMESRGLM